MRGKFDINKIDMPEQKDGKKPRGLWYASGGEWIEWLADHLPGWIGDSIYELALDEGEMFFIKSAKELLAFNKEFSVGDDFLSGIGWDALEEKGFGGIEISPHQEGLTQSLDMSLLWYWGWDVASGCIWDPSLFLGAKLLYSLDKEQNIWVPASEDPVDLSDKIDEQVLREHFKRFLT
jgi:hypothetical protein